LADPALRESLSREARRKAEAEYSWRSVATKYEEVYREALAQRDPPHLLESRGPFKGR